MTRSQLCFTSLGVLASFTSILTRSSAASISPVERSFDVQEGGRLRLESDLGKVRVRTGASARVEVVVTITGSNADEFEVEFVHSGTDVTITGVMTRPSSRLRSWRDPRVSFEITVPHRYHLDLQSAGGAIEIGDLEGEARAKTSGGAITLGQIAGRIEARTSGGGITFGGAHGDVRLETSGGSIEGGEVGGRLDAETSGGSIRIGKVSGATNVQTSGGSIRIAQAHAAVTAETSGGSIEIAFTAQPAGDSRLVTSGGHVEVRLAQGLGFNLDARGEDVRCDFPLLTQQTSRGRLTGKLGGGGPALALRTTGGDVAVRSR